MTRIRNCTRIKMRNEILHTCLDLLPVYLSPFKTGNRWVISCPLKPLMTFPWFWFKNVTQRILGPRIKTIAMPKQIRADHWSIVSNNAYQFVPRGCRVSVRNISVRSWTSCTYIVVSKCDILNRLFFWKRFVFCSLRANEIHISILTYIAYITCMILDTFSNVCFSPFSLQQIWLHRNPAKHSRRTEVKALKVDEPMN